MNEIEIFLRFSFLGLSTLLTIVSLLSLVKTKEVKIAFASIGFVLFTVISIIASIGVFSAAFNQFITTEVLIGTILVSLIFFYLSIVKR